jgi:hypothetical protein
MLEAKEANAAGVIGVMLFWCVFKVRRKFGVIEECSDAQKYIAAVNLEDLTVEHK